MSHKFNIDQRLASVQTVEEVKGGFQEERQEWVLFDPTKYSYYVLVGQYVIHSIQGKQKQPMKVIAYKEKPEPTLQFEYRPKPFIPKRWDRKISEIADLKWKPPADIKTGAKEGEDELLNRGMEIMNMDSNRLEFQYEIQTMREEIKRSEKQTEELKSELINLKSNILQLIQYTKQLEARLGNKFAIIDKKLGLDVGAQPNPR